MKQTFPCTLLFALITVTLVRNVAYADVQVDKNVVYGKVGDRELLLDLYRPAGEVPAGHKYPGLVALYGGAWRMGDKEAMAKIGEYFAQNGYVVIAPNYRLAPEHPFPAQIEDAKCAVRWLRANASQYHVDAGAIAAIGFSAGGHLSLLLGTMNHDDGLEGKGGNDGYSSKVQAVVNYFGPTTFMIGDWNEQVNGWVKDFLGGEITEKRETYDRASPVGYIDEGDASVLTFHGTRDPQVSYAQAVLLDSVLRQHGVISRLELLKGVGHGWKGEEFDRTQQIALEFLNQHVRDRLNKPKDLVIERDIIFGKGGGEDLKLDMYRPAKQEGPLPGLLVIYGGAWRSGNKELMRIFCEQFARAGYVVAASQYRLCPKHKFPAQVEDVKCAVRWMRANAAKYQIDPDRIGAMGPSAGGHLALMLGLMDSQDGMEGDGGNAEQSSKVQAVVNYFGPVNMSMLDWKPKDEHLLVDFLGSSIGDNPDVYAAASPATYVDAHDPPVISFHGTQDPLVPYAQAVLLDNVMRAKGANHELELVPGGVHGWFGPDLQRTQRLSLDFLNKHLKGNGSVKKDH
ncbi:MAG: alpha/beta hydrolase [Planctomycetota bacterium]